ncbi:MAG: hypothetical protein M9942_02035 [Microthrixaceae bacterium]|nr:hypothetical protein [Microthrixaceae bacterium]
MDQSDILGPSEVMLPGTRVGLFVLVALLTVLCALVLGSALLVRLARRRRGVRKRPVVTVASAIVLVALLVLTWTMRPPPFFVPEFPALPRLFPESAFFYRPVGDLPVHERSDEMIEALGALGLNPAASSQVRDGMVSGKPFNLVDDSTPRRDVDLTFERNSHPGPYPITEPAYIQSMPNYGIDEHYIGIDLERREMWELWHLRRDFGVWRAGSGKLWDLDSLEFGVGGTTASHLPMQPMDFTYEEVASGSVGHVIFAGSPVVSGEHVWPAQASDGPSDDPDAPPMGTWLRLRDDVDLSGLGPQARVIAEAIRDHGVVIGDTGGAFSLAGTPDARWDDTDLGTLRTLDTDDLEVVDPAAIKVSETSMEARQPG